MSTMLEKLGPSKWAKLIEKLSEAQLLCADLNDQFEYVDEYKLIFDEINNIKARLYRLY